MSDASGAMLERRSHTALPAPPAGEGLPRPLSAVLPYAVILAVTGIAGAAGAIPRDWTLALAGSAVAAGLAAGLWSWMRRIAVCDAADRYLATGDGDPPSAVVLDERRAILVGGPYRRETARDLRRLVETAREPAQSLVRVPIDCRAVLADADLIDRLADRIERVGVPAPARAMALAHLLLSDAASPVYGDTGAGENGLHRALVRIELELGAEIRRGEALSPSPPP